MNDTLSSWQKTKLKHKTGERKKQLENYFGIKSKIISIDKPTTKKKTRSNRSK